MTLRLLIDADTLCYLAALSTEKDYHIVHAPLTKKVYGPFGPGKRAIPDTARKLPGATLYSRTHIAEGAEKAAEADLRQRVTQLVLAAEGATGHRITPELYISGTGNFRERLGARPKYKGNRATSKPPQFLSYLRDWAAYAYKATPAHGAEADDFVSIAQNSSDDTVIWSPDKDLLQVPGRHLDVEAGVLRTVSEISALRSIYVQVLAGDTADNIPGVPGIGMVRAMSRVQECLSPLKDPTTAEAERVLWPMALEAYRGKHGAYKSAEQAALITMRLVRLLTVPYAPTMPALWEPPL